MPKSKKWTSLSSKIPWIALGPVRQVKPELVFEIAFEGIAASPRHKSGVAVRFPRILRWRHDKKITDANRLEDLKQLLP